MQRCGRQVECNRERQDPIFSHLVQAECVIETKWLTQLVILCKRIFLTVFPLNSELCQLMGIENNKDMRAFIWRAITTSLTPLLLLAMIFPLYLPPPSAKTAPTLKYVSQGGPVRNSLIILYKVMQIYLYFKDCSL